MGKKQKEQQGTNFQTNQNYPYVQNPGLSNFKTGLIGGIAGGIAGALAGIGANYAYQHHQQQHPQFPGYGYPNTQLAYQNNQMAYPNNPLTYQNYSPSPHNDSNTNISPTFPN